MNSTTTPMATSTPRSVLEEFLQHLERRGRQPRTLAIYRHYLHRFFDVSGISSLAQLDDAAVQRFQSWLAHRRFEPTTANYHRTALRMFLRYCQTRGVTTVPPAAVRLQPVSSRPPTTVQTVGLNRLLHFPLKLEGRTVLQYRDRAILELISSSGLRVSEVAALKREHFIAPRGELAVHGRRRLRVVPITQQARYWIGQYLRLRRDRSPALFVRHDPAGGKATSARSSPEGLTPRSVQRLVKKYARAAGLSRTVNPRTLRHTHATKLITEGHDTETIRQRLGFASRATAHSYVARSRAPSRRST